MVPTHQRKTKKGNVEQDVILEAVRKVKRENVTICKAAKDFDINYRTLVKYCHKEPENDINDDKISVPSKSTDYTSKRKIFTVEAEKELVQYIIKASSVYFNLSPKETRKLAYQVAVANFIKTPKSWEDNKMAGEDWYNNFVKRNQALSLLKTEASNRVNIDSFFTNLTTALERYDFRDHEIWSMIETGVTTIKSSDRIVRRLKAKQIESVSSFQRNNRVSMTCVASAIGDHVPPFFVFPRLHLRQHFITDAPKGWAGSANTLGWMQEEDFVLFLRHFHKHTKSTPTNPCLLLLDHYSSYLSIQGLNFAKENGILMLIIPSHCFRKLQPLDRIVFGPLKEYIKIAYEDWVENNPERSITIYDVPAIVSYGYSRAMTPTNIVSGFSCTGISPFNRDLFMDTSPSCKGDESQSDYDDSDMISPDLSKTDVKKSFNRDEDCCNEERIVLFSGTVITKIKKG